MFDQSKRTHKRKNPHYNEFVTGIFAVDLKLVRSATGYNFYNAPCRLSTDFSSTDKDETATLESIALWFSSNERSNFRT